MLKNLPILLLGVVLVGIIGVSCYTNPPYEKQNGSAANSTPTTAVTQAQPKETTQNSKATEHPPYWRRLFVWPEGVEALAISATLFFIAWQALLTREAISGADKAARIELRAYVGVTIAGGAFQDREKQIRFEGIPVLRNTGKTPAHNVRYRKSAAVLREPIPSKLPNAEEEIGGYVLGVDLPVTMHTLAEEYIPQEDVEAVMFLTGDRAFYCWGVILYDDVFGDAHATEFCHRMFFYPDDNDSGKFKVNGHYVPGRNKAT